MNERFFRFLTLPLLAGASALAVLAIPTALAQGVDPGPDEPATAPEPRFRGLIRLLPDGAQDDGVAAAPFEGEGWRDELSVADLDQRLESFDRLVAVARRSAPARAWIEEVAAEGRGELAWTARLALRELRLQQPRSPFDVWSGASDLDEFERMIEEFTQRLAPGWNHRLDPLVIPFPGLQGQTPLTPGTSRSRRVDVQNDADGWSIRVTDDEDGEESVREFHGATLEEILEANPELRDEVGISGALVGPGISLRIASPSNRPFDFDALFGNLGVRPDSRELRLRTIEPAEKSVPTDIFGVIVRPANASEGGAGLYVRSTVPETIAALLGIHPGDVLLEVNGVKQSTVENVTQGLAARDADGRVEAVWRDAQGRRRTGTWRP